MNVVWLLLWLGCASVSTPVATAPVAEPVVEGPVTAAPDLVAVTTARECDKSVRSSTATVTARVEGSTVAVGVERYSTYCAPKPEFEPMLDGATLRLVQVRPQGVARCMCAHALDVAVTGASGPLDRVVVVGTDVQGEQFEIGSAGL